MVVMILVTAAAVARRSQSNHVAFGLGESQTLLSLLVTRLVRLPHAIEVEVHQVSGCRLLIWFFRLLVAALARSGGRLCQTVRTASFLRLAESCDAQVTSCLVCFSSCAGPARDRYMCDVFGQRFGVLFRLSPQSHKPNPERIGNSALNIANPIRSARV
jgi:hypothetical protein